MRRKTAGSSGWRQGESGLCNEVEEQVGREEGSWRSRRVGLALYRLANGDGASKRNGAMLGLAPGWPSDGGVTGVLDLIEETVVVVYSWCSAGSFQQNLLRRERISASSLAGMPLLSLGAWTKRITMEKPLQAGSEQCRGGEL